MAHLPFRPNPAVGSQISASERVESWTASQAADLLDTLAISPARHRAGLNVTLDIPLDAHLHPPPADSDVLPAPPRPARSPAVHTVHKRREPVRRDSLKRREALLRGKEGSRRRRRYDNAHLLGNPHAAPPLPSDWEVQPTHPVHQPVPYSLAPLWDAEYARAAAARQEAATGAVDGGAAAGIEREIRAKLKRARGAKGLLQDLETEIRGFVAQWDEKQRRLEEDGLLDAEAETSEDDEVVFVGRNGATSDGSRGGTEGGALARDRIVFQGLVDDHGAGFAYDCPISLWPPLGLSSVLC